LSLIALTVIASAYADNGEALQARNWAPLCVPAVYQPCKAIMGKCGEDKENCYDKQSCLACVNKVNGMCQACAYAIQESNLYPRGTTNRQMSCQGSNPVYDTYCDFYCASQGFSVSTCLNRNKCYCSRDNIVADAFDKILSNEESGHLLQLLSKNEKLKNANWTYIFDSYDMTKEVNKKGFKNHDFHRWCDGKANTLTIIKVVKVDLSTDEVTNTYIFGGFTSKKWSSTAGFIQDDEAFIFSLLNGDNIKGVYGVRKDRATGIVGRDNYGPTFGSSAFLDIRVNAGSTPEIPDNKADTSLFGMSFDTSSAHLGSCGEFTCNQQHQRYLAGTDTPFRIAHMIVYDSQIPES